MLPIIPKPPISKNQKAAAMAVAGVIDALQLMALPALGFGYVFDDFLDLVAAVVLMAICGFKWQFILAFFLELMPIVDIFPTWTAVVLLLPTRADGRLQQRINVSVLRPGVAGTSGAEVGGVYEGEVDAEPAPPRS